mgnify:CR=1 FL=1
MEVTFSEGGTYKFACYRLTYEESKSPDRIAKIKADLASKGKDGYSIAITYDASPTPPTWDTFANSLLCLDGRLEANARELATSQSGRSAERSE